MERITALARQEISALKLFKQLSLLWANIVSPALIAIVLTFRASIEDWLFWLLIFSLLFLQIATAAINLMGGQLVQEAYFEAREIADETQGLKQENQYLLGNIEYLTTLQAAATAWLEIERQSLNQPTNTEDEFEELLQKFLVIVVEAREEFFQFQASELWNFVIYAYSQTQEQLIPIWREKSHLHPSQGLGRNWRAGQGHIGKAFADCASKITGNATEPSIAELMAPPANLTRPYDSTAYRSFASIPIKSDNQEEQPFGVLVATSDHINRFNRANCLILSHLALALANVIHLKQIDYDNLNQTARERNEQ